MPRSKKELDKEQMFKKIMPSIPHEDGEPAVSKPLAVRVEGIPAEPVEQKPAPQPDEPPVLVNLARIVLESKLDDAIRKFQCCKCELCRYDTLAVALNKTKPHYVLARTSEYVLDTASPELIQECMSALIRAVLVVKNSPNHENRNP